MNYLNMIHLKFYLILLIGASALIAVYIEAANEQQPLRPVFRSRLATRNNQQQQQSTPQPQPSQPQPQQSAPTSSQGTVGTAIELTPPVNVPQPPVASVGANRTTRTADVFQNGDGYNIFVTNTCERESMKVNIKTSRPFYGVIHTKNQRQKAGCNVEGNGDTEYNLEISHILNSQDPAYCGVIKARRDSPLDKDTLSVVVAVRVHRNIELSDDKFFLLNCTNRCRTPDCSKPNDRLRGSSDEEVNNRLLPNGRFTEETNPTTGEREATNGTAADEECTIWKFPWIITLLWCLGILLLAMIISHCIMCSSLVCKCVKTEVEEREPSVYEGASDYDDDLYGNNKRNPYRIEYDNKDIYKTSNNYAPYTLEEAQGQSRRKHKRTSR